MSRDIAAELDRSKDASVPYSSVNISATQLITQSLDALDSCLQSNPDFLDKLRQLPRIALGKATLDGGKFWLGVITPNGVNLRWGKLGTNGTAKHIPCKQCQQRNSVLELKSRVLLKLRKGYDLIPHETVLP